MQVVRLFGAARAAAGVPQCEVDAKSLGELKAALVAQFPEMKNVIPRCSYLVNEVSQSDDAIVLRHDDTVDVLPPFAGGSI